MQRLAANTPVEAAIGQLLAKQPRSLGAGIRRKASLAIKGAANAVKINLSPVNRLKFSSVRNVVEDDSQGSIPSDRIGKSSLEQRGEDENMDRYLVVPYGNKATLSITRSEQDTAENTNRSVNRKNAPHNQSRISGGTEQTMETPKN